MVLWNIEKASAFTGPIQAGIMELDRGEQCENWLRMGVSDRDSTEPRRVQLDKLAEQALEKQRSCRCRSQIADIGVLSP